MDVIQFKKKAIAEVIDREGGSKYTNRAADMGGPTRWGVTHTKAREFGYKGHMSEYPYEEAYKVYEYIWNRLYLDNIAPIDSHLAVFMFDFGVNSGESRAAKYFQSLLNILNNRQKLYSDITPDGRIGSNTMKAFTAYRTKRGQQGVEIFRMAYNSERVAFFTNLAHRREDQEENLYGWLSRVISIAEKCGCK